MSDFPHQTTVFFLLSSLSHVPPESKKFARFWVELQVSNHGRFELVTKTILAHYFEVTEGSYSNLVREVIFKHGEQLAIKIDQSSIGDTSVMVVVDYAEESLSIEEEESDNT